MGCGGRITAMGVSHNGMSSSRGSSLGLIGTEEKLPALSFDLQKSITHSTFNFSNKESSIIINHAGT